MLQNSRRKEKYCWHFWPFFKHGYQYIPEYLKEKEKRGFRFSSLGCFSVFAKYQKVEPQEVRYDIDVFRPKAYIDIQPYLDLCEDSGWELRWQWDEYKIFRTIDGKNPTVLQSDLQTRQEQEAGIIKRNFFSRLFFCIWFTFLFYILQSKWSWSQFYLDSYGDQWIVGIAFIIFIAGFFALFFQMCIAYRFYCNKKNQREFEAGDSLKRIKRWMGIVKNMYSLFAFLAVIISVFLLVWDLNWSIFAGGIIGGAIGTTLRVASIRSNWPSDVKMKGIHSSTYYFKIGILFLTFFSILSFAAWENKEILEKSNFCVKEITKSEDYYTPWLGGSCLIEVRQEKMINKIWVSLDEEIRGSKYFQVVESNGKREILMEREILKEKEREQYGDYDMGFLYPQKGRVLLRKGKTIYITDKK